MPYRARLLAVTLLVVLAVALWPRPSVAASQPTAPAPADFGAIDAYLEAQMQASKLPGLALAIVHGDQIVHQRGFGRADSSGRPVTPQTPFLIASVTKQLTALAVLQLAEAGRIELDAPVQRYLPWFQVADAAASSQITVRQLLSHTSGLPVLPPPAMIFDTSLGADALEQRVRALRDTALTAPPGTRYQYSNAGYAALALIIEAASGQSWAGYLQQQIYEPLEMRSSFVSKAEAQRHGLAMGYRYWFGRPFAYDWSYNAAELGGGFTFSSAEDLAHYLIAQLNEGRYGGSRLLSAAGLAEMQQPAAQVSARESYGLGWFIKHMDGVRVVSHSGAGPNLYADLVLLPDSGWGFVLLMNGANGLQQDQHTVLSAGVASLLLGGEPPAPQGSRMPGTLLRYALLGSVLGGLGVLRSVLLLRRWRARPATRPRGWLRISLRLLPPLLLSLLWALLCLVGVAQLLGPLFYLRMSTPDLGYTLTISGSLALGWGLLRPLLLLSVLRAPARERALPVPGTI